MRRLAYLFGGAAAAGAGTYLVVYLYRWQWQRAILCGVLLLVVEVMLLGAVLLGRLARVEERLRDADRRQDDVLARLRQYDEEHTARAAGTGRGFGTTGPGPGPGPNPAFDPGPGPDFTPGPGPGFGAPRPARRFGAAGAGGSRFRWLDGDDRDHRDNRTYVFVPVLMVTGVLLSGLAWVVQRVASATARPAAERRLAGRLAVLAAPPPDTGLEDLPPVGTEPGRRRRLGRLVAVGGVSAALLVALVVGLAELTQTREEHADGSEATSVLLRVDMRGSAATPERRALAAHQLWERCRDSTSVPLRHATLGSLDDDLYAGVVHPALTSHDRMRLRGCLEDTGLDKAHLTVVGIGDADADDD